MDAAAGQSPLTQWWVPVLALLVALALTVWILRRRLWRRERRGRFALAVAGASVVWLVVAALGVNSWFAVVPDLTALQRQSESALGLPVRYRSPSGGHVEERFVPASPASAVPESSVWVYTPPGYDPSGSLRYPVVYLIHGDPGTSADWFTLGGADEVLDAMIRTKVIPPVIAVAPDVNGGGIRDSECLDSLNGGPRVESWLYEKLVPWVDETFLTHADWQHRILGGMSAGGYCALDQGLRHQSVWGGIVALEGYGDPGLPAAAGMGYDHAAFQRVSPSHYIPTMAFDRRIPIFLNVGELDDPHRVELLAGALDGRGQPAGLRVEDGQDHSWAVARLGLAYGLAHVAPALGWMR